MMEKLKDRYVIMGLALAVATILIAFQLVNIQVIHGKEYDEISQRRLLKERSIAAPRGNIVDRNGVPIAVNRLGFTVQIVKTKLSVDQLNDMLLKLVNLFEKNNDTYSRSISKYLTINPIAYGSSINNSEATLKKWKTEMVVKAKDIELLKTPEDVFKYFRNEKFKISSKYTDEEAYKIMTLRYEILMKGYSTLNPLCLARDVSRETVAQIEERHPEFSGVTTEVEPMRKYIEGQNIAHIIGYVRGLDGDEYKRLKDEGYDMNDIIGKSGIELAAEKYLKGKDGQKKVEVDIGGRLTEELQENPAIPGDDVVLTIDSRLQKIAMESLERNIELIKQKGGKGNYSDANAGAVVAIDVKNGELLAMASYPSYDPSIFLEGADNKEAQKAISDLFDSKNETKPAFNRAISGTYAPGSTFKPLTSIAALEEGVITPQTVIYDSGATNIGGWDFKCLEYKNGLGAHGALILERALATSCNIYFHEIGYRTGIDNLDKWGKLFGLGEYTGIDISSEQRGIRANKDWKKKLRNDIWRPADTAQTAIGQFDNAFTPIQLANYIGTLANGGKRFKPHLIKRVVKYDGSIVTETEPVYEDVKVKPETLAAVKNGMMAVTYSLEGTAAEAFTGFPYSVAGKTGTAETSERNHSSNALFVCFAPAEDPKIAVAVVVERGAWGANTAPIARDVLAEYFDVNSRSSLDDKVKMDEAEFTR